MSEVVSRSFPAVSRPTAERLILGSLPGKRSLSAGQYYAQPQNAFWRIMGAICGAGPERQYSMRLEILKAHGIALWDVVASGIRPGSLDSAIDRGSVVANDFVAFFEAHSRIRLICFNGRAAADLYRTRVMPALPRCAARISSVILPSTSPAYAAMNFEEKLSRWSRAFESGEPSASSRRADGT
jgi:TDG/mug DNA glycosylase family protein